uniref:DYW domain-containing protein n=1 Tax=Kalanchoe fedtschenkoi TaxID=63787 RepID=A0A7N0VLT6_KALFE
MFLSASLNFERQKLADFLRKCSKGLLIGQGLKAHAALEKMGFNSDLMLSNDLIDMYAKCGRVDIAAQVFDKMPDRNVVSWTSLMSGCLRNGDAFGALSLFLAMWGAEVRPNEYTLSTAVKACWSAGSVESGSQVHAVCVKTGFDVVSVVGNSIIDMYAKCGRVEDAARLFDAFPEKNAICYNVMIAGYASEENGHKAVILFRDMRVKGIVSDEFSYASVLKAVGCVGAVRQGAQVHASLIVEGFPISGKKIVAGALIDLYVKCGCVREAREVFEQCEEKSVVSWTTLILGYAQNGSVAEAMECFRQLMESGVEIDGFVISSLMGVFADLALVDQGKQTHCYAMKLPFGLDLSVCNSVVDMYLKCGLVEEAERHFDEMPVKNVISWTVMITGYGKHGIGESAVRLFDRMQSENVQPDEVSYLAVLSACSHSGLVKDSQNIFFKLCLDRHVKPKIEHYACVVDSLGRAGRLQEARNLIDSMPFRPNAGIWQTLLSACKVHGNVEMGREVGNILLDSDGENSVNYVMLSNIFANAGYWKDAEKVREIAKTKGLKKVAGRSWVEIDKKVHIFFGGDDTHPLTPEIHAVLEELEKKMKEESGYTHMVQYALHDVEEESKAANLKAHSEKLALGLALICHGLEEGGDMIRIFKNLRVCGDCHEFIKGVSKILKKVFLVRDSNRFHKFENGLCSCKDYW